MTGKLLLILSLAVFGVKAQDYSTSGPTISPGCVCPAIFAPVCGTDGRTYGNACQAGCANVPVASQGECGSSVPSTTSAGCACTLDFRPVCGVDGVTYGNACGAACAGVAVASNGECATTMATRY